jgi:hypothetical protein
VSIKHVNREGKDFGLSLFIGKEMENFLFKIEDQASKD